MYTTNGQTDWHLKFLCKLCISSCLLTSTGLSSYGVKCAFPEELSEAETEGATRCLSKYELNPEFSRLLSGSLRLRGNVALLPTLALREGSALCAEQGGPL